MSHKRKTQNNIRLKKTYIATCNRCIGGGVQYDSKKKRLKRFSCSHKNSYPKYLKRLCNKKIRKYYGNLKRNDYRKISGYIDMLY